MKWQVREAVYGDMVRVQMGALYHYGIFANESEIIQFGQRFDLQKDLPADQIEVCTTDANTFCGNGFLEVAVLSLREKLQRNSPDKTVQTARSRLGERGYAILANNCETFANECMFGKKYSAQVEDVRTFVQQLPVCDVYVMPFDEQLTVQKTGNEMRDGELDRVTNPAVRRQKYAAWILLEYAVQRSFGYKLNEQHVHKDASGSICLDGCRCSLSHCGSAVAVAVSRDAVGVDVEPLLDSRFREGIEDKILNREEKEAVPREPEARLRYLTRCWTQKESLYKAFGRGTFHPKTEDTLRHADALATRVIRIGGSVLALSAATNLTGALRWYLVDEKDGNLSGSRLTEEYEV